MGNSPLSLNPTLNPNGACNCENNTLKNLTKLNHVEIVIIVLVLINCIPVLLSDVFLPCPDNLLVNLQESKEMVSDLLNQLPTLFESNRETGSALGAALQAAYKLIVSARIK